MAQEPSSGTRLRISDDPLNSARRHPSSPVLALAIVTPVVLGSLLMFLQARDASMVFLIGVFLLCTGAVFHASNFMGAVARALILPFAIGLTMWFLDISSAPEIMVLGIESLGLALVLLRGPFWERLRNLFFSSGLVFFGLWFHHTGDQGVPLFLGVTGLVLSTFVLHQTSDHTDAGTRTS